MRRKITVGHVTITVIVEIDEIIEDSVIMEDVMVVVISVQAIKNVTMEQSQESVKKVHAHRANVLLVAAGKSGLVLLKSAASFNKLSINFKNKFFGPL